MAHRQPEYINKEKAYMIQNEIIKQSMTQQQQNIIQQQSKVHLNPNFHMKQNSNIPAAPNRNPQTSSQPKSAVNQAALGAAQQQSRAHLLLIEQQQRLQQQAANQSQRGPQQSSAVFSQPSSSRPIQSNPSNSSSNIPASHTQNQQISRDMQLHQLAIQQRCNAFASQQANSQQLIKNNQQLAQLQSDRKLAAQQRPIQPQQLQVTKKVSLKLHILSVFNTP
jgi:hypothetical protein